ncbi:endonuclease domain-containing protein [Sphingomonas adhaesiva]|uniref:endonuclease domain-containing protein n=1 Tax=Sphingomonas adhaesiva TaxID=28212 RepID=UPI002FF7A658
MLKDVAPRARQGGVRRARTLRRKMTLPEVLLWQRLRGGVHGCRFRRQHPSGPYVLDFYGVDARLAIEVDGAGHDTRRERDARRDAWFAEAGIRTVRIAAARVLADADGTAAAVLALATARLPLHHPAKPGGPPPRDELGEDR